MLLVGGVVLLVMLQGLYLGSVAGWFRRAGGWVGPWLSVAAGGAGEHDAPLAWCAYLMVLLGFLAVQDGRSWLWRIGTVLGLLAVVGAGVVLL